jgi:hypothetical protein
VKVAHPPKTFDISSLPASRFRYNHVEFNYYYASNLLAAANGLAIAHLRNESRNCGDRHSDAVVHAHFHGELRDSASLAEAARNEILPQVDRAAT